MRDKAHHMNYIKKKIIREARREEEIEEKVEEPAEQLEEATEEVAPKEKVRPIKKGVRTFH